MPRGLLCVERMVIHDVELVCSFYNLVVTAYLFFWWLWICFLFSLLILFWLLRLRNKWVQIKVPCSDVPSLISKFLMLNVQGIILINGCVANYPPLLPSTRYRARKLVNFAESMEFGNLHAVFHITVHCWGWCFVYEHIQSIYAPCPHIPYSEIWRHWSYFKWGI